PLASRLPVAVRATPGPRADSAASFHAHRAADGNRHRLPLRGAVVVGQDADGNVRGVVANAHGVLSGQLNEQILLAGQVGTSNKGLIDRVALLAHFNSPFQAIKNAP